VGLWLLFSFSGSSFVWAGHISIQSQVDVSTRKNTLDVAVTVTNHGDESARNVQIKAEAPAFSRESAVQSTLPVGKSDSATFHFPISRLSPGRYPLIVRILYTDANLYPFSALTVSSFARQQDIPAGLIGILEGTVLRDKGRLTLKLKNLEDESRPLHIRLITPHELSADPSSLETVLAPHQEASYNFSLANFSALSGSSYPVYGLIEYDRTGVHNTAEAMGIVRISDSKLTANNTWLILLGILAVLFAFINVRAFRKSR